MFTGSLLFTLTIVNGSQDVPFTLIGFDINSDVVSINSDNGQVSVQDPPDFDSLGVTVNFIYTNHRMIMHLEMENDYVIES